MLPPDFFIRDTVARNLLHARERRGLSLNDLAAACGIDEATLAEIESKKIDPGIELFRDIAIALALPFGELLSPADFLASVTDPVVKRLGRFDVVLSVGASHHLDTGQFLESARRHLPTGGWFLVADEMIAPFHHPAERQANLIAHHLQYIVDTLADIPIEPLTATDRTLITLMRRQSPLAIYEARTGAVSKAAQRCRNWLEQIEKLCFQEPPSHELLAFYRFHCLELEALVAGLDYEVEQKTYPQRFADLATRAGFSIEEHLRLYATHGCGEWDGGTHFFALQALP